jgi:hypothetical protein
MTWRFRNPDVPGNYGLKQLIPEMRIKLIGYLLG